MVVPKKHIKSMNEIEEIDENLIGKIFFAIKKIAKEQGIAEQGYRVISNCGNTYIFTFPSSRGTNSSFLFDIVL